MNADVGPVRQLERSVVDTDIETYNSVEDSKPTAVDKAHSYTVARKMKM